MVFVNSSDFGLDCTELPAQINQNEKVLNLLQKVRVRAAVKMGMA